MYWSLSFVPVSVLSEAVAMLNGNGNGEIQYSRLSLRSKMSRVSYIVLVL
jgi:hypothetical protein